MRNLRTPIRSRGAHARELSTCERLICYAVDKLHRETVGNVAPSSNRSDQQISDSYAATASHEPGCRHGLCKQPNNLLCFIDESLPGSSDLLCR